MACRRCLPLRAVSTCVALGVFINVAIAWACALQLNPDTIDARRRDDVSEPAFGNDELARLRMNLPQTASDDEIMVCDEQATGAQRRVAFVDPYWHATTGYIYAVMFSPAKTPPLLVRTRSGWPMYALEASQALSPAAPSSMAGPPQPTFDRRWMIRMALANDSDRRVLPLQPLWPGFVINTMLYAALAWLLLFAPIALRRHVRRHRNLCEHCGYPRGSSSICTECGATLNRP